MERLSITHTHKDTRPSTKRPQANQIQAYRLSPFTLDALLKSRNIRKLVTIKSTVSMTCRVHTDPNLFHSKKKGYSFITNFFEEKQQAWISSPNKTNSLHPHATTHFLEKKKEKLNKTHPQITAYTHKLLTVHLAFSSQIPPEVISSACYQKAKKDLKTKK